VRRSGRVGADFGLAESERVAFEAQLKLDQRLHREAIRMAYEAMLQAAKALIRAEQPDVPEDAAALVEAFRRLFYDTRRFFDPYAAGSSPSTCLQPTMQVRWKATKISARRRVEEAQLFIEARMPSMHEEPHDPSIRRPNPS